MPGYIVIPTLEDILQISPQVHGIVQDIHPSEQYRAYLIDPSVVFEYLISELALESRGS